MDDQSMLVSNYAGASDYVCEKSDDMGGGGVAWC